MLWHVLIYRAGDSHFSCDLTFMLCAILRANQCQPRRSLIPRNSGRPASVKEKSKIRQAGSAFLFILILADPLKLFNGVYHDMAHSAFIIADH